MKKNEKNSSKKIFNLKFLVFTLLFSLFIFFLFQFVLAANNAPSAPAPSSSGSSSSSGSAAGGLVNWLGNLIGVQIGGARTGFSLAKTFGGWGLYAFIGSFIFFLIRFIWKIIKSKMEGIPIINNSPEDISNNHVILVLFMYLLLGPLIMGFIVGFIMSLLAAIPVLALVVSLIEGTIPSSLGKISIIFVLDVIVWWVFIRSWWRRFEMTKQELKRLREDLASERAEYDMRRGVRLNQAAGEASRGRR